ncbi:MAG: alpha/beta hydrolase [Planctomycetaceae bacterium]|jgi:acetyl esterase/lipase|nr:alpha/beta hydrolase [Planctomycetaceae bacterium]
MSQAAIRGMARGIATATASRAAAVALGCAVLAGNARAAEPGRDWSQVQLARRDDPRVPADLPAGNEVQPRVPSRRAARRAARRGRPLDGVPVVVGRPAAADSLGAAAPVGAASAPVIALQRQPPLGVEATLGSPFAVAGDGVLAHRDLPVAAPADTDRRFDLYLPDACAAGGLPLVVWIAGGDAWDGTRAACPLRWLVPRGYAVACVGYRSPATAVFPAQLDDCRAALATLVRDADTWGIDATRICVIGCGTGGHLAALVALADSPAAADDAGVAAACAIAAPTDLPSLGPAHTRTASAARQLIGGPLAELREAARAASPLAHVSADDPPLLLVHGGHDAQVPADQAVRLDAACRAAGIDCRLVRLDGVGHDVTVDAGTAAGAAVLAFLDRVLADAGGPKRGPSPAP